MAGALIADSSNIVQLDAQGFLLDPSNPRSGLVGTTLLGLPVWDAVQTAAHLTRSHTSWADIHPDLSISYSYGDPTIWATGSGYLAFDARGQQAAQLAMQLYADVSGITFHQSADANHADLTFLYIEGSQNGGGFANYPWSGGSTINVGNVSWEPVVTAGTYSLNLEMHELGHAMGLSHPGDYDGSTAVYSDADHFNDSDQYTNMSYWDASHTGGSASPLATLGLHDILAIQMLYGINWATRAGDTTYGFHSTAGLDSYDFSYNDHLAFSVWDGGGVDTLDFSGFVAATILDLRQGSFSSNAYGTYNVSIAYGAIVENGIGGGGDDKIHGNEVGNVIDGGAGNDTIYGGDEAAAVAVVDPRDFVGIRLNFDPSVSNQYLEVAHLATSPSTAFTLEMMVAIDRAGAGPTFATLSPNYGIEFEVVNGIVQATVHGSVYSSGYNVEQIVDGLAHRLSLSWNSVDGAIKFYVDGSLISSGTIATGASLSANGRFVIGEDQTSSGGGFSTIREFDGTIGDIRLFNDVRTDAEITDNAFTRLTGNEQGLIHNWQVTSGTTTSVNDVVAGGTALTVVNGGTVHDTAPVVVAAPDNDTLIGGFGRDVLHGGVGDDHLFGDTVTGHLDAGGIDLVHLNKAYNANGWSDAALQRTSFAFPASAVTFEMVLHLDTAPNYASRIISYGDNAWDGYGGQDFTLRADLQDHNYQLLIGGDTFDTGLSLATSFTGAETRLSITWDRTSGAVAVYLDGVLAKSGTAGAAATLPAVAALDIMDGSFMTMKGAIGDIRVWDHVRSASEIAADAWIAYASSAGKIGLVADWQVTPAVTSGHVNLVTGSPIGNLAITGANSTNPALFENVAFASRFNDTLDGGIGNDVLRGGQGDDSLGGGAGIDTGDWSDASGNVTFTLGAGGDGSFTNAATGTDTYTSLENVVLGAGNDHLTGDGGDNALEGGGGDDVIDGSGGTDTVVYKGARSDFSISFNPTTHAPTVADLRAGAPEGTDTLINIEFARFSDTTLTLSQLTNQSPTQVGSMPDLPATEDAAFAFTLPSGMFADPDAGDTLALSVTKADGTALPAWLTFNAATRTFSGTPVNADIGTLHLKVTATDGSGASVSGGFDLTIANTNDAPTLVSLVADQAATEDAAFAFTLPAGTFADVDAGDTLTLAATKADGTALPSWLSFTAATRTFSGTPVNADVGTLHLKVIATDGAGSSAFDTFDVTTAAKQVATVPVTGTVAIANASVVEGDSGTVTMTFTVTRTGGTLPFDVGYATHDGIAMVEDNDYVAKSGTLHFADGATTATIDVTVNGDVLSEGDQAFCLTLANPTAGAALGNAVGVGTIVTDDTVPASNLVKIATAGTTTHTGAADDLIVGSSGADTLYGDGGNDTVFAGAGSDSIYGGDGADTLVGNADIFAQEHDLIDGGAGDDKIYGEFTDTILGGTGYDILYAVNAYDLNIDLGAASIELMIADFGNDTIDASTQTNAVEVVASGGNDTVTGSAMNDRLWGGTGDDVMHGGAGDDMLFGDIGADKLYGDAGNDVIYADASDIIDGGAGFDVVYITTGAGATIDMGAQGIELVIDLAGGANVVTAATMSEGANVYTGAGADSITGSAFDDCLWGMAGNDTISAGAGDDVLVGGTGADVLTPGAGNDRVYLGNGSGGDGAVDRVVLQSGWGSDLVYDFEHGTDRIDMTALHTSFAALTITATANGSALITLGTDTLTVAGLGGILDHNDFQF